MKRLLIYSHDTFGLGNMRRMTSIATYLTQKNPELNILLLSGSNALPAFQLPERIDYVKLPCLYRNTEGDYDARSLSIGLKDIIQLRANLILNAALDFKPDLIVVDKKPFGVANELEPVLSVLGRRINPPRMVLLLRDILDDAKETRDIWDRNGYHDAIDRYYEAILVVGDQNVYDLGQEYEFPVSTRSRIRYCGYIRKNDDQEFTSPFGTPPPVLVTPGGGEDGERLVQTFMDAMSGEESGEEPGEESGQDSGEKAPVTTHTNFESLVCLGPDLNEAKSKFFIERSKEIQGITCLRFTNHMAHHMSQAKVLVTMGGYNTIYEGLSLQKAMIVVPRTTPSREQEIRAQRLSEMGLLNCVMPENLTPVHLRTAIECSLQEGDRRLPEINFEGLSSVNREIQKLCGVAA